MAKADIEALQKRVEIARSNLMLSLLICLQDESQHRDATQDAQNSKIIGEIQKSTKSSAKLTADVETLTQKLTTCILDDPAVEANIDRTLKDNQFSLRNLTENTKAALEDLNSGIRNISSDIAHLSSAMDQEIIGRRRVRESLYFSKMNQRRESARRAHGGTYEWIFKRAENQRLVWDNFMDWLEEDAPTIYWISGKPGSGKTTLMRELDEYALARLEDNRVASKAYLKASCYFWYAGSAEEKSIPGLLKSLVYQLFRLRPDLIDKAIRPERWKSASCADAQMPTWTLGELVTALKAIAMQIPNNGRLVLFIDGLDEVDGQDEDRDLLVEIITSISTHQNVRVCTASRPWPIFTLAFKSCPQLRLENLTKDDIRKFARDKLSSNRLFCEHQQRTPALLEDISSRILEKARGVFLWVFLVVRDLLNVLRDGGGARHLLQELERIPPDLDEYFKRMMTSIAKKYRNEASTILQTALHNMDYLDNHTQEIHSGPDLLLGHLEFIDQAEDTKFSVKPQAAVTDFSSLTGVNTLFEILDRRLASRSMGLLESRPTKAGNLWCDPWKIRIDFLHRTARDYFLTSAGQSLLSNYASSPVDVHVFRLNLLVLNFDLWKRWSCHNLLLASANCFFHHMYTGQPSSDAMYDLFEKLVSNVESEPPLMMKEGATDSTGEQAKTTRFCQRLWRFWKYENHTPTAIAIMLDWKPYICSRLTSADLERPTRSLLSYALQSDLSVTGNPYPDHSLVEALLQSISRVDGTTGRGNDRYVWLDFMLAVQKRTDLDYSAFLKTIQVFVRYIFERVPKRDLQFSTGGDVPHHSWSAWIDATGKTPFSVIDVARVLAHIREGKLTGDALIAEEDIAGLEAILKEYKAEAAHTEHQPGQLKRWCESPQSSVQCIHHQRGLQRPPKRIKTRMGSPLGPHDYIVLD